MLAKKEQESPFPKEEPESKPQNFDDMLDEFPIGDGVPEPQHAIQTLTVTLKGPTNDIRALISILEDNSMVEKVVWS